MKQLYLVGSIVALQASKCILLILAQPLYPLDLSRWVATLYPPWQRLATPAPYGLPWYVLYAPGLLGMPVLAVSLALAEGLTLLYLFKRKEPFIAGWFSLTSLLIFFWDPFDLWSYLFILLSIRWRPLLAAAVLVKIPLGAPSWVWQFIVGASLRAEGNWPHYIILGAWWLGMLWYVSGIAGRFNLTPNRVGTTILRLLTESSLWKMSGPVMVQRESTWSRVSQLGCCLR